MANNYDHLFFFEDYLKHCNQYYYFINKAFPKKANIEFAQIIDKEHIKMRVWERGAGKTLACGTGACAAVIAAVLNGYCKMNENITVDVRGGKMIVKYTGDSVFLSGNTELLYEGDITI